MKKRELFSVPTGFPSTVPAGETIGVDLAYGLVGPFAVELREAGERGWRAQAAGVRGPALHADAVQAFACSFLLLPAGGMARVLDALGVTVYSIGADAAGRVYVMGEAARNCLVDLAGLVERVGAELSLSIACEQAGRAVGGLRSIEDECGYLGRGAAEDETGFRPTIATEEDLREACRLYDGHGRRHS